MIDLCESQIFELVEVEKRRRNRTRADQVLETIRDADLSCSNQERAELLRSVAQCWRARS